ncbi:MAG: ribokinase [Chthonomonadales bacterium]|nr:ribokinase [Chthonomonadales bacterium]
MQRRARIAVIGSSNTDMVVKTERIPAPGETVLGGDFVMVPGGKGANQAVAAARLGGDVAFVARVGTDVFGDRSVESIGLAGVDTRSVLRDLAVPSGVALIFVDARGQNSIVVAPGANMALRPACVESARPAIASADVLVLQCEVPLETVAAAIRIGKELGKLVILNPAPAQRLPDGFLDGVSVITPNEVEASLLLGCDVGDDPACVEAARALVARGVGAAVITRGARGAVAVSRGRVHEVPARRVQVVDTTAAGDCFTGALACALGEGTELGPALHFANAAAALSVTRMGAHPSLPTRAEVDAFIAQR